MKRTRRLTLPLLLALTLAHPAHADDPAAEARVLFERGNELFDAGAIERALEMFLGSRAKVPSFSNTLNIAIAYERLGRLDEALEHYEILVAEFSNRFQGDEKRDVATKMSDLRRRVASLDVSANVPGSLVVDGRSRGPIPRTSPLRIMPGRHRVRVIREGYAPSDDVVETTAGGTAFVDDVPFHSQVSPRFAPRAVWPPNNTTRPRTGSYAAAGKSTNAP